MSLAPVYQAIKQLKNSPALQSLRETYRGAMGYRKMGLRFDDLIPDEGDVVREAVRRLPPIEQQDRIFRFRRALNASAHQTELPKDQWTKPEEVSRDVTPPSGQESRGVERHRMEMTKMEDIPYLRPIIEQIDYEQQVKEEFDLLNQVPEALKRRNRA
ncbi:Cytochrome b-c1 complex subunit 7 [Rhizophlyctis rosea]|nr:Cytochrome b-c1 complex subunit 7 [Rhizophlyctis rosea]